MEWYVFYHDFNADKIIEWNIFNHGTFRKSVKELLTENIEVDVFKERLKSLVLYYFWSKCEYEIIINPMIGKAKDTKVDISKQIMMNFNVFAVYVLQFKTENNKIDDYDSWNETYYQKIYEFCNDRKRGKTK